MGHRNIIAFVLKEGDPCFLPSYRRKKCSGLLVLTDTLEPLPAPPHKTFLLHKVKCYVLLRGAAGTSKQLRRDNYGSIPPKHRETHKLWYEFYLLYAPRQERRADRHKKTRDTLTHLKLSKRGLFFYQHSFAPRSAFHPLPHLHFRRAGSDFTRR